MPRLFREKKLVIATHNKGKLVEFQALLAPYAVEVISAGELGLPSPEETGTTFEENALLKARAAMAATGLCALADDSGLCVNALGGEPGLYSLRWCGETKDPAVGMAKIRAKLDAKVASEVDFSSHFVSLLALVWPDNHAEIVEGRCDGQLVWPPRGSLGHGFDPWFVPDGETRTFGEMTTEEKQALSHRGRSMEKLLTLFERP